MRIRNLGEKKLFCAVSWESWEEEPRVGEVDFLKYFNEIFHKIFFSKYFNEKFCFFKFPFENVRLFPKC